MEAQLASKTGQQESSRSAQEASSGKGEVISSLQPEAVAQRKLKEMAGGNKNLAAMAAMAPLPDAIAQRSSAAPPAQRQVIQRLSAEEAHNALLEIDESWANWYFQTFSPALQTIAARHGQTLAAYLGTLDKATFQNMVRTLHEDFKQEPEAGIKKKFMSLFKGGDDDGGGNQYIDSEAYDGMKRLKNTNLLVHPNVLKDGEPAALRTFANNYQAGNITWYRGIAISHFSWNTLKESGVLASEGTADIPTFTMDNAAATRWLPGLYDINIARGIAQSVSRGDAGLRDLASRQEVPIGCVVQYTIANTTPIAYLNDGEQVVRGPVENVTIAEIHSLGPDGPDSGMGGSNPSELPPGAPYQAAVGSAPIIAWEAALANWLIG